MTGGRTKPATPAPMTIRKKAFDWGERSDRCVNRRFFDWPDAGSDAIRAFDLRDRLAG